LGGGVGKRKTSQMNGGGGVLKKMGEKVKKKRREGGRGEGELGRITDYVGTTRSSRLAEKWGRREKGGCRKKTGTNSSCRKSNSS